MTDYTPHTAFSCADLRQWMTRGSAASTFPEHVKRMIASADGLDDEAAHPIYIACYEIIRPPPPPPAEKPKKARKPRKKVEKPKPTEKTDAELEAEAIEAQKQLLDALTEAYEKYSEKMAHLKDTSKPDVRNSYGKTFSDICPNLKGDAGAAEQKQFRTMKNAMEKILFAEWLEKQTKPSGRKRRNSDDEKEKLEACRDYTGEEGKNERTATGETMTINDFCGRDGEIECKVISYFNHTDKHGVELPENQKVILNISSKASGAPQVQPKPALRKEPIDQITACKCRVKPNFFKNVYEREEDGSWSKISADWGWAPCNIKLAEGQEYCSRHMLSLASETSGRSKVVDWERDMLLVPTEQIV